jgi:transposase-like protein
MTTDDVECLLCHSVHSESFVGNPSRAWRCGRCGQNWDDARLTTVMNYQRWAKAQAAAIPPIPAA